MAKAHTQKSHRKKNYTRTVIQAANSKYFMEIIIPKQAFLQ